MMRERLSLVACACALAAAGCPSETDPVGTGGGTSSSSSSTSTGGGDPAWQVIFDETVLDRAVVSVWGSSERDVFVVGGPLGNSGFEALALHFDGTEWRDLAPGGSESFWWVHGTSSDDVWMVGTEGRIAHYDGQSFVDHPSGTTATLWGVWAASPDDAWAVGGTPGGGTDAPNDIVLHWDGSTWKPEALPGEPLGGSLFKVWGTSSDNLYAVGEAGIIWHRKGTTWAREPDEPLAKGTLFTVHGCSAAEVYAVGNYDVLRTDGNTWSKVDVALTGSVNGVSCSAPGAAAIVGSGGLKQRLEAGTWINEFTSEPYADLHAVWSDPEGAYWVVGGEFISKPAPNKPRKGVVARYGRGQIPTSLK